MTQATGTYGTLPGFIERRLGIATVTFAALVVASVALAIAAAIGGDTPMVIVGVLMAVVWLGQIVAWRQIAATVRGSRIEG